MRFISLLAAAEQGHIKGAKLIPAADMLAHVDELPRDKMIVTYCYLTRRTHIRQFGGTAPN